MELFVNTTNYIIANNYYLIDYTGKPTTWGYWGPDMLNDRYDDFVF